MTREDVETVGRIWLDASLQAHDFVPASFWRADHEVMTAEILPEAHGYVHESDGEIDGFVVLGSGPRSHVMGALFVRPDRQSRGVGTRLLEHVKTLRDPLDTSVYKQNTRALGFYRSRGFRITGVAVCEHTGCEEHRLRWSRHPSEEEG
jgi:putative acetyltransferase